MMSREKKQQIILFILPFYFLLLCFCLYASISCAEEGKWSGVDESVVERFAEEHGRGAREPLINTDQGDLLLFVFFVAGSIAGFLGGYSWRRLMEGKNPFEKGFSP